MKQARIKKEAAKWLIELETAENIDDIWPTFEAWRDADPQHRAAFASMEDAWKSVEELQVFHIEHGQQLRRPLFAPRGWFSLYRPVCWIASALAAVAVTCVVAYQVFQSAKFAPVAVASWDKYATDYGEYKPVRLADGSLMEVDTDTLVRVNRASGGREVVIERGQALFEVKHDPNHPFVVHAGNTKVQAVGTRFSVWRKTDARVVTLVKEGTVKVGQPPRAVQKVGEQQMAISTPSGTEVTKVDPKTMKRMLSWEQGELHFDGETLTEVVEAFNRYNRTKMKIDDVRIAQRRIGGSYSATDPMGFAKLLERTFGIHSVLKALENSQTQVIHLSLAKTQSVSASY